MRHGELTGDRSGRWCEVHQQEHGLLFVCEHYPPELRERLVSDGEELARSLFDTAWIQKQIENGVPPEVIAMMQIFAGGKPR